LSWREIGKSNFRLILLFLLVTSLIRKGTFKVGDSESTW
jgi:hypothetical protein